MNIIDFCEVNKINWFPIHLDIKDSGKLDSYGETKYEKKLKPYADGKWPDMNDFKNFTKEEILERQKIKSSYIAIDTSAIFQIDIDTKNYCNELEFIKNNTPYFKSSSKSYGIHLFVKPNQFKPERQTKENNFLSKDVEFFYGSWCFSRRDAQIFNSEMDIIEIDKYIKEKPKTEPKSPKNVTNPTKPIYCKIDNTDENILLEHIPKFIDNCYTKERASNYDSWRDVIFSLTNSFNFDTAFNLCKNFSLLNLEKYDENYLINLMNNCKRKDLTFKSLYFWAKNDNLEEYKKIVKAKPILTYIDFTHAGIAKLLYNFYPTDFLFVDKDLYCYNGKCWEKDDLIMKKLIAGEFRDRIKHIIYDTYEPDTEDYKKIIPKISNLGNDDFIKKTISFSRTLYINKTVKFDENADLLGFNNGVYDFKQKRFRQYEKTDYISFSTKWDYREATEDELNDFNKIIDKILPTEEHRNLMYQIYSTGLRGKCLENFILLNGKGGNGKSFLNKLMLDHVLGDYGFKGNNEVLTKPISSSSNPALANFNKKRLIVFEEPDENIKLSNSTIKELTGGSNLSVRKLYSNDTDCKNHLTMILECNERPNFNGKPTNADYRRLIDIYLPNKFTKEKEQINNIDVFEADETLKDFDRMNNFKYAIMTNLINFTNNFDNNIFNITIPDFVKERSKEHLLKGNVFFNWFLENTEKTDNKNDLLPFKIVYERFRCSETYTDLTKQEKRSNTVIKLKDDLKSDQNFSKYYHERLFLNKIQYKTVLQYYKFKEEDEEEDEDMEII